MGGGTSKVQHLTNLGKSPEAIVELMMPLYYDPKEITTSERKIADDSWQLIVQDKSPVYLAKLGSADFHYKSCITFFYDTFYMRMFDIHPMSKEVFKAGIKGQSNALIRMLAFMLSIALNATSKPEEFKATMTKLAHKHHQRGIKAVEYGILGDVLFWTIRNVVGDDVYTQELHHAWVRIYSRMLKVVVPAALEAELHDQEDVMSRAKRQEACVFTTMKLNTEEPTAAPGENIRDSELVGSQKMLRGL